MVIIIIMRRPTDTSLSLAVRFLEQEEKKKDFCSRADNVVVSAALSDRCP